MDVEEVDVTLELSVAPEEMAEFDSDGDDEDGGVEPSSNMGQSVTASSNRLPHQSAGGAGHIRVRMETAAKFGLEHMLAMSNAAAPNIAEKYECLLCQPGKYFLEPELKHHLANPRHLKSVLQLVDLKAYNECQFSEDSSELRKRLGKLLPSQPLSAIHGPVPPTQAPGIHQQIKNDIAAKKAKVRDDFIKQHNSSNQQVFSSKTPPENSVEQSAKGIQQATRASPRISARTPGRSVFDRLSKRSNDLPETPSANNNLAVADTPVKAASDSVESFSDIIAEVVYTLEKSCSTPSFKTSFDKPATRQMAGHFNAGPVTSSPLPKPPSVQTHHNGTPGTPKQPSVGKRNSSLWSSRLEAPKSPLTTTSPSVNVGLHNTSAAVKSSVITHPAKKMETSQLSPVQVPRIVVTRTLPETSPYPVFQPGSSDSKSLFDHVVIVGQIAIVRSAFDWGTGSSDRLTFLELDCLQLEKEMPKLLDLKERLPSKTLWLFPGDVSMLTPLVPGTAPNSQGTSINCNLCRDPETQAYEFSVPSALSKNEVTALVNKLSLELASFRKRLPREADVLLTVPAPHMITCISNSLISHLKFHELLPMPSVRFCTSAFLKVLNLSTTFLNGWSDIIRRTLISHRLGAIVKKYYCDMNSLRFHRAEVLSQETLDKTAYNRAAWLRMMWNIINSSLGNEKQVLAMLPSKDPLQRQFFPPIRPAAADIPIIPASGRPSERSTLPISCGVANTPATGTNGVDNNNTTPKTLVSNDATDSITGPQNARHQSVVASDAPSVASSDVEFSITVSNIPNNLPLELMGSMASACGQVTSLVMNPDGSTSRVIASFASSDSAAQAARLFDRLVVNHSKLVVKSTDELAASSPLCPNDMKVRSNISWVLRNAHKSFHWVSSPPAAVPPPAAVSQPGNLDKVGEKRERSTEKDVKDGGTNHNQTMDAKKMKMDPDSIGNDLKPIKVEQNSSVFNNNLGSTSAIVTKVERPDVSEEPMPKKSKLEEQSSGSETVSSILPIGGLTNRPSSGAKQGKSSALWAAATAPSSSGRMGSALPISGRVGTLAMLKPSAAAAPIINREVKNSSPKVGAALPLDRPVASSPGRKDPSVLASSISSSPPAAASSQKKAPEDSSEAAFSRSDSPPRSKGCGRMSSALPPSLLRLLKPTQVNPSQPQQAVATPPPPTRAPALKKKLPSLKLRCTKSNVIVQKFIEDLSVASAQPNRATQKATGEWLLLFSPEIACVMAKLLDGLRLIDARLSAECLVQPIEQSPSAPANSEIEATLRPLVHKSVERYNQKVSEAIKCEFFGSIDVNNYKRDFCKKTCPVSKCYKIHNEDEKRRDVNKHKYGPERCPTNECEKNKTCKHSRTANERALHPSLFQRVVCTRLSASGVCSNPQPCVGVHPGSPDMFYHPAWEDLFLAGLEKSFLFLAGAVRTHFKLSDTPKHGPRILFLTSSVNVANQTASIIAPVAATARLIVSPINTGAGNILLGTPEGVARLPLQSVSALILDDASTLLCDPLHAPHTARLVTRMRQIRLPSAGRLHVVLVAGSLDVAVLRKAKQVFAGSRFRHDFTISGTLDAPHEVLIDLVPATFVPKDVREEALKSPEPLHEEPVQQQMPPPDEPVMAFAPPPREPAAPNSMYGWNGQAEQTVRNKPHSGPHFNQPLSGQYPQQPHRNKPQSGPYHQQVDSNQPQSRPYFQQPHGNQPPSGPYQQQPPPTQQQPSTPVSILKPQQISSNKDYQSVVPEVGTNNGRYHDWKSQLRQLNQLTPTGLQPVPKPVPPPAQLDWKSTLAQNIVGQPAKGPVVPQPVPVPHQQWKAAVAETVQDHLKTPVAPTSWDQRQKTAIQGPGDLQKENVEAGVAKKAFKSRWDHEKETEAAQALPLSSNKQEPQTQVGTWKQLKQSDLVKPGMREQPAEAKPLKEPFAPPPVFGKQTPHLSSEERNSRPDQWSQKIHARQPLPVGSQQSSNKQDQWNEEKGDQWNRERQWKGDQSGQRKGVQSGQQKGDQSGQWKGDQSAQWKGDQSGQWKGDQSGQWKGDQSGQWKGDQAGQWKDDQSGQRKGDQSGQWKGDQSGQWKGDQSGQWKGDQSGQWKGDQSGQWKGDQSGQWKGDQSGQWKDDQSGQWKGDQSGQWKGDQSGQWKGDQSGQRKGDQSGQWKGDQSGQRKGDQSGQWKGDQSGQWKGDQSGQWKSDQSGQWKGDQSGQWKGDQSGQWKGDQSGQWKGDQSGQWKGDQSGQWKGDQSRQWKGDQSGQWKGDQSGTWKGDQSGPWKGDQSGPWKGDQSGQWKGDQSGQWKGDQSGQWKGDQSGQWKGDQSGQWKDDQSGQSKGDQSGQWKGDQSGQWKGDQSGQWNGHKNGGHSTQIEKDPRAVWKGEAKAGEEAEQWYPGQEKWSKSKAREEWSEQRVKSNDQTALSAGGQQHQEKVPTLPGPQPWPKVEDGPKHWAPGRAALEGARQSGQMGDYDARLDNTGVRASTHLPTPNKLQLIDSNSLKSVLEHFGSVTPVNEASNVPVPNSIGARTGPPSMVPPPACFSGYNTPQSSTPAAYDAAGAHSLPKAPAAQVPEAAAQYAPQRHLALGHSDYDARHAALSSAVSSNIPMQPGRSNNYASYGAVAAQDKSSRVTHQGYNRGQPVAQAAPDSFSGHTDRSAPTPSSRSLKSVLEASAHAEEPQHFPPPPLQTGGSEMTISSLLNVPVEAAPPVPGVFDVEEAYSVLERLAPSLDVLTPALNALIAVARRRGSNTPHAYKLFVDKEHVNLMNICLDNFREQVSTASPAYAMQLQRGIQLAQKLLEQSRMEVLGEAAGKTKHSLNVDLIASTTLGKEQSEIADYIRGAALYTGVTSLTSRDVSELLIKVACRQQEMRQLAAGKYKNMKDAVLSAMMI